jgi:hypothetical protein
MVWMVVGAGRFELPTSWSRTLRANQTALRPDVLVIDPPPTGGIQTPANKHWEIAEFYV